MHVIIEKKNNLATLRMEVPGNSTSTDNHMGQELLYVSEAGLRWSAHS